MSGLYSILKSLDRASTRNYSRSNIWEITVSHEGLNKYRIIRGKDKSVVEQKADAQLAAWNEMWQRKSEKEQKTQDRQTKNESAIEQTREASEAIKEIENILKHALNKNYKIDWEALKNESKFLKQKPQPSELSDIPKPPKRTNPYYQPKFKLLDKIFPARKQEKIDSAERLFKIGYNDWLETKEEITKKMKNFRNSIKTN
jgi:restriction system protein